MDLKQYLQDNGITASRFAMKVGVCLGTIQGILKGKEPKLETALIIEVLTNRKVTCEEMVAYARSVNPKVPGKGKWIRYPT